MNKLNKLRSISFMFAFIFVWGLVFSTSAFAYTLSLQATEDGANPKTDFKQGEDLLLNIIIDDSTGLAGCAFTVLYDATHVTAPPTVAGTGNDAGTPVNAGDITSIFPFAFGDQEMHRENSAETGKIYLSGATIDPSTGGAKPAQTDAVLFTIKFKVRGDALIGSQFSFDLVQTELFNPAAGYGENVNGNTDAEGNPIYDEGTDTKDTVPLLVSAVPSSDTEAFNDFDCSDGDCAFPVLLDSLTSSVTTGSLNLIDVPRYNVSGTVNYDGHQAGDIHVGVFSAGSPYEGSYLLASTSIPAPGDFTIAGVPEGSGYYLAAFRDSDAGINLGASPPVLDIDSTEAQGELGVSFDVAGNVSGQVFAIEDPIDPSSGEPLFYVNWKTSNGWTSIGDTNEDYDKDGYSNIQEYLNKTDPTTQDAAGGEGYDQATDARVAPWTPIEGNEFSMIVSGSATADGSPAQVGDWIGAFGPGGDSDCRAVFQVETQGQYFLTVRGNTNGDAISFKYRRNSDMKVLNSQESVTFTNNDTIDTNLTFTSFRTQSISFIQNWNWVSFNVLPDDTALEAFFGEHLNKIDQIKTQTTSMLNHETLGWIGDDPTIMSKIAQGQMFKIKVKEGQPFTLSIDGQPIDPKTQVNLNEGWSWVAYLPDDCLPVADAVATIFEGVEQVKSQVASRLKVSGTLVGDMTDMCPGYGYTIKMSTADGILEYPAQ